MGRRVSVRWAAWGVVVALGGCAVEQTPWPGADGGGAGDGGPGERGGRDVGEVGDEGTVDGALRDGMPAADAMAELDAMVDAMTDVMTHDAMVEADAMMASDAMVEADAMPDAMTEPDAMPEPGPVYRWLVVADVSAEENRAGTAGADICGVVAACDGAAAMAGATAEVVVGAGVVCDGTPSAVCGMTRRDDPAAALDDGAACEGGSAPSDYVSLGVGGELAIGFGRDLRGCRVTVVELAGRDAEGYEVFACETPELAAVTCLGDGAALGSSAGGRLVVDL